MSFKTISSLFSSASPPSALSRAFFSTRITNAFSSSALFPNVLFPSAPSLSSAVARLALLVCFISLLAPQVASVFFELKLLPQMQEAAYRPTQIQSVTSDSSYEEAWIAPKSRHPKRGRSLRTALLLQKAATQLEAELPKPLFIEAELPLLPPDPTVSNDRTVTHTIVQGDNIELIWRKYGSTRKSALLAAAALTRAGVRLERFKLGETLQLVLTEDSHIKRFGKQGADGKMIEFVLNESGKYQPAQVSAVTVQQQVVTVPAAPIAPTKPQQVKSANTISGSIESSFFSGAKRAGLSLALVDDVVDLFSDRIEFRRDLQPGDTFVIQFSGAGEKSVISAASIVNNGKLYAAVRHEGKTGKAIYFNEQGTPIGDYFLRYPVQFTRVSSVFNDARLHPVLGIRRPHLGVDFAAPTGTPVRAVAAGRVTYAGYDRERGYSVKITHDGRYATSYLHLSKIAAQVKTGTSIDRGAVLGAVGMTGLATGPHLHFSLFDQGRYVDPMRAKLPLVDHKIDRIPANQLLLVMRSLEQAHESISGEPVYVAANTEVEAPLRRRRA